MVGPLLWAYGSISWQKCVMEHNYSSMIGKRNRERGRDCDPTISSRTYPSDLRSPSGPTSWGSHQPWSAKLEIKYWTMSLWETCQIQTTAGGLTRSVTPPQPSSMLQCASGRRLPWYWHQQSWTLSLEPLLRETTIPDPLGRSWIKNLLWKWILPVLTGRTDISN